MATLVAGQPVHVDVHVVHAFLHGLQKLEEAERRFRALEHQVWSDAVGADGVFVKVRFQEASAKAGRAVAMETPAGKLGEAVEDVDNRSIPVFKQAKPVPHL